MIKTRTGRCECGAFTYQVSGEPKTTVICHCHSCQRQSGSAFGMSMVLASDQFVPLLGELHFFNRVADSGTEIRCHFCPQCGTRIYHEKLTMPENIILKPGTLDDTHAVNPLRQLWATNRQEWLEIPTLPAFERQPH